MSFGPLAYLDEFQGNEPPKRIWNAMLQELIRRLPRVLDFGIVGQDNFIHPWKTTCTQWDDDAAAASGLPPELIWRVDVQSAFVNDAPVRIQYLRSGDPRGWQMPQGYPVPSPGDPEYSPTTVERPMYERTDPPFLVLQAPPAGQPSSKWQNFVPVPDAIRPEFFQSSDDMWAMTLMRASVFTTADPAVSRQYNPALPPTLQNYQLFVGKLPIVATGEAGGFVEIARIYLTRTPDNDPSNDATYVQQLVFFDLQAAIIQPAQDLVQIASDASGGGVLGQLEGDTLGQLLQNTAQFMYWTT